MVKLLRTNSENPDFQKLVIELDKDLKVRDGNEHDFFAQYNKIDKIQHVVIAFSDNIPLACGALKHFHNTTVEIKRMFVPLELRGNGFASVVLKELELWGKELGYTKAILETGIKQPEAIRLYEKNNYKRIPNYEQYEGIESSVCFEKSLV